MNDPEKPYGYAYRGPSTKDMLDWLDQFRHSASLFVIEDILSRNGQPGMAIVADGVIFPDNRVTICWRPGVNGGRVENWGSLQEAMRCYVDASGSGTAFTVIPVANIVHALGDALSVSGMVEVTDDAGPNGYAHGWNGCRRQIESYASKRLRTHFEPTLPRKAAT